ncbi:MAG: hypothetical protein Q7U54_15690 [Bacteroidales bacterium]|nr:hypothetical protein [Bacteroidales bacterium]
MTKSLYTLLLLLVMGPNSFAQLRLNPETKPSPTSIGIVIYSDDAETVWNAMRFANFAVSSGDTVEIFLLGKGVVMDTLAKYNSDIKEQSDIFLESGGIILGCGTCLRSRNNFEPKVCKMSSMSDLYDLVRKNKIMLTF